MNEIPWWAWAIGGGAVLWVVTREPKVPIISAVPGPAPVGASPSTIMIHHLSKPIRVNGQTLAPSGWYWRLAGGEATSFPIGWHGPYVTKAQAVKAAQAAGK